MYGQPETSNVPRLTCGLIHLFFLAIAAWVCLGQGGVVIWGWLGVRTTPGDPIRGLVLFLFGLILFLRLGLTVFYLLKRKFGWAELWSVVFGLFCYQIVFSMLGAPQTRPLGVLDFVAIALFIIGSILNTGSELQRKRFKDRRENQGRLYTKGLFRYACHINYFGDALWATGWAMLTRNGWSFLIPAGLVALFVFMFIPSLSKYLKDRYGEQYDTWAQKTKAFVPFIY